MILRLYVRARRNNKEVSKFCCVISCSFDDTEKHKNIEKWVLYIKPSFQLMIWALRCKYYFKGSSTCMSRVIVHYMDNSNFTHIQISITHFISKIGKDFDNTLYIYRGGIHAIFKMIWCNLRAWYYFVYKYNNVEMISLIIVWMYIVY